MSKYYEPPTQKVFDEIKKASTGLWETYDNEYGYVDEKVGRIKDLKNILDNAMTMVAMFDCSNQVRLAQKLSIEARKAIRERMFAGGNSPETIVF